MNIKDWDQKSHIINEGELSRSEVSLGSDGYYKAAVASALGAAQVWLGREPQIVFDDNKEQAILHGADMRSFLILPQEGWELREAPQASEP